MRRDIVTFFSFLVLLTGCELWPGLAPGSPPAPEAEPALRQLRIDRDGNDDWDSAGRLAVRVGQGAIIDGELGEVDRQGVLDQVDVYRFTARASGLELRIEGEVDLALVTADGSVLAASSKGGLWLDDLSLDGSYGLKVTTTARGAVPYVLSLVVGAHVRAACAEGCRLGLICLDERCAQDGMAGEACMWDQDCRAGRCVEGQCQDHDPVCHGSPSPGAGCRSCMDSSDCQGGVCYGDTCYGADGNCEPALDGDAGRCRGGSIQTCSAGLWHNVGRCDTGCFGEACAPASETCATEGATLCMGSASLVCQGGQWRSIWAEPGLCPGRRGLEGEGCSSDGDCQQPFACLQTELTSGDGVCALTCTDLGLSCLDGATCGADWSGRLFCMDQGSGSTCDLTALEGCPGEVVGACLDGRCLTGCTVEACPGPGCACGSGLTCVQLDDNNDLARSLGVCVRIVGPGSTCNDTTLCQDGAVCLLDQEGDLQGQCYRTCTGSCSQGESCVALDANLAVCLATAAVGQSCGVDAVCERSAVCVVEYSGASEGVCRRLCTSSTCDEGETCTALSDDSSACFPD
ncbi:MAG: hypothetical protein ABIJ09_17760 [Pseudomonadota bacterium]